MMLSIRRTSTTGRTMAVDCIIEVHQLRAFLISIFFFTNKFISSSKKVKEPEALLQRGREEREEVAVGRKAVVKVREWRA